MKYSHFRLHALYARHINTHGALVCAFVHWPLCSDPYVKVYLNYNGQRIAKKKTHIKKRTLNPVYNESFIFDLPSSSSNSDSLNSMPCGVLAGVSLEMVVLAWDQMTKNEVIGRLEIGTNSGDEESSHWAEVISFPRKQIANWHELKD